MRIIWLCIFIVLGQLAFAQQANRIEEIANKLNQLSVSGVPLNDSITITLNGSIQEFVTFLAESTGLNITIDPTIQKNINASFSSAPIKDVLLYLCDLYQLDLKFTGQIIQLVPYHLPQPPAQPRVVSVEYSDSLQLITLDLKRDTLADVVRRIAQLSQQNIVVEPSIRGQLVDGYINKASIKDAIRQLAQNNNLEVEENDNFFRLKPPRVINQLQRTGEGGGNVNATNLYINKVEDNRANVQALNVPILEIIKESALQLDADYFILPDIGTMVGINRVGNFNQNAAPQGVNSAEAITIQLRNATFKEILEQVCKNSDYSYKIEGNLYIIGKRTAEGIRNTKLIQMQYRSAKGVIKLIPQDLLRGVYIDTLLEYNSLIVSGSERNITEVDSFLKSVDKLVPVIMIELIEIYVQTNKLDEYGIEAGVSPGGRTKGGNIVSSTDDKGGIDFSFSPKAINNLLRILAGRGIINIGQVSSDFYLTLKAVQEEGFIEIKSTPRLSTLNSHPASLSIGETRYYLEQQVNFPGTDRPIPVQSNVFQSVEANLDIDIIPIISGDEQVTLEIQFEQSEFLADPGPNAPPPQISRKFESMIRVRNGEMVVLGGLERETESRTKRGVPFFSKIPLIGWIFGKHRKVKSKDKLLIFVKPIIVY